MPVIRPVRFSKAPSDLIKYDCPTFPAPDIEEEVPKDRLDFYSQLAITRQLTKKSSILEHDSLFIQRWDMVIAITLVATAVLTPYEVALVETLTLTLFSINMLLDVIFFSDMIITLCLEYWEENGAVAGGNWVKDPRKIWIHYFQRWFWVDILSIAPIDIVGAHIQTKGSSKFGTLKMLRLFRLVKLVRVLKASRLISHWEDSIGISSSSYSLIKFLIWIFFLHHWLTCLWCFLGNFYLAMGAINWISVYFPLSTSSEIYLRAFYFVAQTILTIGYGNILPTNIGERWGCVFIMLSGSFFWSYCIGTTSGFEATVGNESMQYYIMMDEVNNFLEEKRYLDKLEKEKIRWYFRKHRQVKATRREQQLILMISPSLRSSISMKCSSWTKHLSWHKRVSTEFLGVLTQSMSCFLYAPQEKLPSINHLCVVVKGAAFKSKLFVSGSAYGEDLMLHSTFLKDKIPAYAINHTELMFINKKNFMDIAAHFSNDVKCLRRFALKVGIRRAMLLISAFAKCGWKFSEATRIPFVSHGKLCKEIGVLYESFIHQLHPELSTNFQGREKVAEDIQSLIQVTELTEIQKGETSQKDLLGFDEIQFKPSICKNKHTFLSHALSSIESEADKLILQVQRTGALVEELLNQQTPRIAKDTEEKSNGNSAHCLESSLDGSLEIVLDTSSCPTLPTSIKKGQKIAQFF